MEKWFYDELKQVGINFGSEKEVEQYDLKYKSIRNLDREAEFIARQINLKPDSRILEIGTGTGEHAVRLAGKCLEITACDVSETMLNYAKNKADNLGITNIKFVKAGFLTSSFPDCSFDAVISQLVLHHLPDFWKSVAINNVARMLKREGIFYLLDSILTFEIQSYGKTIKDVIEFARKNIGEQIAEEIIVNIRDEYPTYDWIIENLMVKNGFTIKTKMKYTDVISLFVCSKQM